MNKIVTSLAALAMCVTLGAQETKPQVSLYGFIRNFYAFDTRESVAGTEDFFYYLPKDENKKGDVDLNEQSSLRYAAITSRIGLNVTGYEYNGLKFGAKIEPDVFSLNTGAPFGPFSRTPQVKLDYRLNDAFSLTGSAIWQMQYNSAGPNGASANYIKYSCTPEIYLGLNYKNDNLLLRAGVDMLSIKPRNNNGTVKVTDRITTVTPFVFAHYKNGLFSAKMKTIFAEAGEHFNLNGGYGISGVKDDKVSYEYTPTRNSSTWVSLMYGKKTQWILFGGYVKNFGTKDDLLGAKNGYAPAANLYFSKNSFSNMNQMWRLTPTVIRNIGKFAIGLEYELTSVQYGEYKTIDGVKCIGANGLAEDNLHWITNNRVQALVKFTF